MKHLTNIDQWKEGDAVTDTRIFDRSVVASVRDSAQAAQVNRILLDVGQQHRHKNGGKERKRVSL